MDVAKGVQGMPLQYYDPVVGRERLKPRYKWAAMAFVAGVIVGSFFAHVI
jgi:hypothetical protein